MRVHVMVKTIIGMLMMVLPADTIFSQLVINEIMQNPEFVGDTEGEWFELYNTTAGEINVNGWTIRDIGTNSHIIDNGMPLLVPPFGYLVLGRVADTLLNGNVPVGYAYGNDITLGNGTDQLIVEDQLGNEIDMVEYDGGVTFPDPAGASMELLHPLLDNDLGASWAEASTSWNGNDKGTPLAPNSRLDTIPPTLSSVNAYAPMSIDVRFSEIVLRESAEDVNHYGITPLIGHPLSAQHDSLEGSLVHLTVSPLTAGVLYTLEVSDVKDLVGNMMAPEMRDFLLAETPSSGSIIVTEIMKDPSAVTDASGEWFEVYNSTELPIDLQGWEISDDGSNLFTVSTSFVVPPFGFGVFTVNADSSTNGGMDTHPVYDWGSSSTFTLGNGDDKIIIRMGDTVIDSVTYDSGTFWPDTAGASIGLKEFTSENNDGTQWTIAHLREPAYSGTEGDYGSPGTLGSNQSPGNPGGLSVTPSALTFFCGVEDQYSIELSIANNGDLPVSWSIASSPQNGSCSWLTVEPDSGTTAPGSQTSIAATASGVGLDFGIHYCEIVVTPDSPLIPEVRVTVSLHVLDTLIVGTISIDEGFLPIPPTGDTVIVHIKLQNLAGVSKSTETWVTLLRPGSSGPKILGMVKSRQLAARDSLIRESNLAIPAHGPSGQYELSLNLGNYPDSVQFTSTFGFEKASEAPLVLAGTEPVLGIPGGPVLFQNHPNPFNASTRILYGVNEDTWVTLVVYDILGQEVITLVDQLQAPGYKEVSWNGTNKWGNPTSSGWYLYRLRVGSFEEVRRMMQLK